MRAAAGCLSQVSSARPTRVGSGHPRPLLYPRGPLVPLGRRSVLTAEGGRTPRGARRSPTTVSGLRGRWTRFWVGSSSQARCRQSPAPWAPVRPQRYRWSTAALARPRHRGHPDPSNPTSAGPGRSPSRSPTPLERQNPSATGRAIFPGRRARGRGDGRGPRAGAARRAEGRGPGPVNGSATRRGPLRCGDGAEEGHPLRPWDVPY